MSRLHRTDPTQRGIRRFRRGRGFSYVDHAGRRISDERTLARIRALAIPPAWTNVWVCPTDNGHLQAVGTDSAGRRQYRYHQRWQDRQAKRKFDRMLEFARALPDVRERVARGLGRDDLPKERVLCCAVRLLDLSLFRIGSEAYARSSGSFGLATLRREHVRRRGDEIVLDFVGKGGKRHVSSVRDPSVRSVVDRLKDRRDAGGLLWAFRDEDGTWRDLRSKDVNDHLKAISGGDFSAKDFRTWHATVLSAVFLARTRERPASRRSRDRAIREVVAEVAHHLGNTPAVCRRSYIDPRVIDRFTDGWTIAPVLRGDVDPDLDDPEVRTRVEQAVLDLIDGRESASTQQIPLPGEANRLAA